MLLCNGFNRGFHMHAVHWHATAAPARWGLVLLSLYYCYTGLNTADQAVGPDYYYH
jgi:hypothetical protein